MNVCLNKVSQCQERYNLRLHCEINHSGNYGCGTKIYTLWKFMYKKKDCNFYWAFFSSFFWLYLFIYFNFILFNFTILYWFCHISKCANKIYDIAIFFKKWWIRWKVAQASESVYRSQIYKRVAVKYRRNGISWMKIWIHKFSPNGNMRSDCWK